MDKLRLRERLVGIFVEELEDHVRALNRDLLALEQQPEQEHGELIKRLFRTAHSIKGAARSAGVEPVESACHRLEATLGALRDGMRPLTPELLELLLSAADALQDAAGRLRAQQDLRGSALQQVLPQLDPALQARAETAPPPPKAVLSMPASRAPDEDGSLRVAAAKLDALAALGSELLLTRRRLSARQEDMAQLREMARRLVVEWRRLEKPLRTLSAPRKGGDASLPLPLPLPAAAALAAAPAPAVLPRRALVALGRTKENVRRLEQSLERLARDLRADQHALDLAASALEQEVRRLRMLPFAEACEELDRAARDLAKAAGKDVELVIEGAEVELDRAILERLKDPLLHLVRNAIDHGIEPPAQRAAAGKPGRGRVSVAASLRGDGVEVVVADDGAGLDLQAIHARAAKGQSAPPSDPRELQRLIFQQGFSTAAVVTELSGRGVGLDVVRHRAESLHGSVEVSSEPGRGTRFALLLPLTLTTLRAVIVVAAGELFALPTTSVRRLLRIGAAELGSIDGREVALTGGTPLPIASLAATLGLRAQEPARSCAKLPLVVVAAAEQELAFAVDALLTEQEVVVKSLGKRLRRLRHVAGATVLQDGRLALILTAGELVQTARRRATRMGFADALQPAAASVRKRLLVADDSVTTRSLEKSILEAAGYEVVAAADGLDAWQLLQDQGADLVVADVEMPRMDGFSLTEAIRDSKRFRDLPVVLVTALQSERDRARGLEAGADAYLAKSAFDQQQLLATIAQLL